MLFKYIRSHLLLFLLHLHFKITFSTTPGINWQLLIESQRIHSKEKIQLTGVYCVDTELKVKLSFN